VKDLPKIKQISCGLDHFVGVDHEGKVWAMGDDTFGQCGQGGDQRKAVAPFFEIRHRTPQQVPIFEKVTKVVCGFRHSLAITESGKLLGWGFNSMQQLSHAEEYADPDNPSHALFSPTWMGGEDLENKHVVEVAAGEEHTIVVAQVIEDGKPVKELVYGCGNNLKG